MTFDNGQFHRAFGRRFVRYSRISKARTRLLSPFFQLLVMILLLTILLTLGSKVAGGVASCFESLTTLHSSGPTFQEQPSIQVAPSIYGPDSEQSGE